MVENTLANGLGGELIGPLRRMFHQLHQDRGIVIDGAALTLAYDGQAGNLFILNVSMPNSGYGDSCINKTECLIRAAHQYIPPQERQGLAAFRVFDTRFEFDQFVEWGSLPCEPCEASMPLEQRLRLKPKEFAVEA